MGAQRPPRAAVRAALRDGLADLEPGDRIIVALSGGADSLALTGGAAVVSAELGLRCEAVVVDHQLQARSAAVAARAAEQAGLLGCADVRVVTVDVPRGPGTGGVEAAARAARYAALDAAAAGSDGPASVPIAAAVLLGHTREDQAETVLLGLARGSGTRSLAGMRPRAGRYRRPLLDLPRDVVAAAAWAAAESDPRLEPWTDPHNGDPTYARVRVRTLVLPLLESTLGPGIVEALARTAALAQQDADALDDWADRIWAQVQAGGGGGVGVGGGGGGGVGVGGSPAEAESPQLGGLLPIEGRQPSRFPGLPPSGAPAAPGLWSGGPGSVPASAEVASAQLGGLLPLEGPQPAGFPEPLPEPLPTLPAEPLPAEPLTQPLPEQLPARTLAVGTLPVAALRSGAGDLPPAVVHRVIRRFLVDAGCPASDLSFGHIRAVAGLLEPKGGRAEIALPSGVRARRVADVLVVRA